MSEINVLSRTQYIIVEPITGSVAVISAGPIGPMGEPGVAGDIGDSGANSFAIKTWDTGTNAYIWPDGAPDPDSYVWIRFIDETGGGHDPASSTGGRDVFGDTWEDTTSGVSVPGPTGPTGATGATGATGPAGSLPLVGCRAYRSSNSSNLATSTTTPVEFNAEFFDTSGFHDNTTLPSQFVIPLTGYYEVDASCRISLDSANKSSQLTLYKNNVRILVGGVAWAVNAASESWPVLHSGPMAFTAGDIIELRAFQSGSPAPVQGDSTGESTWFAIRKVDS